MFTGFRLQKSQHVLAAHFPRQKVLWILEGAGFNRPEMRRCPWRPWQNSTPNSRCLFLAGIFSERTLGFQGNSLPELIRRKK